MSIRLRSFAPIVIALFIGALVLIPGGATRAASLFPNCTLASLQAALTTAGSNNQADTILLPGNCTYTVTSTLTIGADNGFLTTIRSIGPITVFDGGDARQILSTAANSNVVLDDLRLINGSMVGRGGAIQHSGSSLRLVNMILEDNFAGSGGAISADGPLEIEASQFIGNVSSSDASAIWARSTLSVLRSTFTGSSGGNTIFSDGPSLVFRNGVIDGGSNYGIYYQGNSLTVANSIIRNVSRGAIYSQSTSATNTYNNLTIVNNGQDDGSGQHALNAQGNMTVHNRIISSPGMNNCYAPLPYSVSGSHNVDDDGTCGSSTYAFDMMLDPTTLQPRPGSPAIDAGSTAASGAGACETTDLIGTARNDGDGDSTIVCDAGALEALEFAPPQVSSTTPSDTLLDEGENTAFTLSRTGDTTDALDVTLRITQTGVSDGDYALSGGSISGGSGDVTVTIPAGEISVDVTYTALDDGGSAEPDERIDFSLIEGDAYDLAATEPFGIDIAFNGFEVTVDNGQGAGTLYQALANAAGALSDDTITFNGVTDITPSGSGFLVSGSGVGTVTLEGSGVSISGGGAFTVFQVEGGATVTANNLTFTNGLSGGVLNDGSLMLNNVQVSGSADSGIFNNGVLTMNGSRITGNTATVAAGLYNFGTATLNNTLIDGNTASHAAAIYNLDTLTLNNVTLAGNSATAVDPASQAAAIYNQLGTVTLNSTIMADNGTPECRTEGGTFNASYSLIEDGLDCVNGVNTDNLTGDPALDSDYTLLAASPAVNAGDPNIVDGTDFAGNARVQAGRADMGALESSFAVLPFVTVPNVFTRLNEGDSTTFTVTRTGSTSSALTVSLTITLNGLTSGVDYTLSGGSISGQSGTVTVEIPAGESSVTLTFAALDDGDEAEEEGNLFVSPAESPDYTRDTVQDAELVIARNGFVVTTGTGNGEGSLHQALVNANELASDDTITFSGVTTATAFDRVFLADASGTLTIDGGSGVTLSGRSAYAAFDVTLGATVTANNITFTQGLPNGILNAGTLTLNTSTVSGNTTGISNSGTLTLNSSTVSGNTTGISNSGTATLNTSTVRENTAVGDGGGIVNDGMLTLNEVTLRDNAASGLGAGLVNNGTATLSFGDVRENAAVGPGGGIYNNGSLTLTFTDVRGNTTEDAGGGIFNAASGTVALDNSSVRDNVSSGPGGGMYNNGSLTLLFTDVRGNGATAGAGIYTSGPLTVDNSLIVGNSGGTGGGGGLHLTASGTADILNSTIAGNSVSANGAGVWSEGTLTLSNSIIANNTGDAECRRSAGTVNASYSLIRDNLDCVNGTNTGNLTGDPGLSATYFLLVGSPAVNAGDPAFTSAGTDFAGNARVQDGRVDMGAVEGAFVAPIVVSITPSTASAAEGAGDALLFTVTRSSALASLDITLSVTGTAVRDTDYTLTATAPGVLVGSTLTLPAGTLSATLSAAPTDDARAEGAESVTLTVLDSAAYDPDPVASTATGTIADNDTAGVSIAPAASSAAEGGVTALFSVVLTSQPTADVLVSLTFDTAQIGPIPASLTFTAADWNIPQLVTVTAVDDTLAEGTHTADITFGVTSGDTAYNGLVPPAHTVTITDNEAAGVSAVIVTPTIGLVTTEAGGTAQFSVVLASPPTADVVIALGTTDSTEGVPVPDSLTFTPATWNTAQTVTVTGVDDDAADGDQAYSITASVSSADAGYDGLAAGPVGVTNDDDDAVGLTIIPTAGLVTTEAGGTAQFTVVLDSEPTASVVVSISSSNPTEGTAAPDPLTFTTADWDVPQTVTVTGVDDAVLDGDRPYWITMTVLSADIGYNSLATPLVSVTNTDDEVPPALAAAPNAFTLGEGETGTYTLRLTTPPSAAPVTVRVDFDTAQISVNGSAVSPIFLNLTSSAPVPVAFAVRVNADVSGGRDLGIAHTVSASPAAEYPVGLSALVRVRVNEAAPVPPPPPTPLCEAHNFEEGGVVRSSISDALGYAVNCRILYQNGRPTTWLGNALYGEANLGVPGLIDLGVQQAIDIFSPVGRTYFEGGAVFCLRGSGTLIWLAASGAPRVPAIIGHYTVPDFPGFTCATLFEPGTLVLVSRNPAG
jgi:hypothetical protein